MVETCTQAPTDALQERERAADWITALLPSVLFALLYYRGAALLLPLLAVGGYLMVCRLLHPYDSLRRQLLPAVLTGLLTAFFLPSTAPYWPAALVGGVAALAAEVPVWLSRKWPQSPFSRPLLCPALVGYMLVRAVFPAALGGFTLPALWQGLDSTASVAALLADKTVPLTHLLFGIHSGPLGGTCEVVVLLGALYLLLRRRLRLLAPACMLATVALLSLIIWGRPLGGLLVGGTVFAALLLADRTYAPADFTDQAVVGVVAGAVTVLVRSLTAASGGAVGVLAAGLLQPALPYIYRFCRFVWRWLAPLLAAAWRGVCRGAAWLWPRFVRLCVLAKDGLVRLVRGIYKKICKKRK